MKDRSKQVAVPRRSTGRPVVEYALALTIPALRPCPARVGTEQHPTQPQAGVHAVEAAPRGKDPGCVNALTLPTRARAYQHRSAVRHRPGLVFGKHCRWHHGKRFDHTQAVQMHRAFAFAFAFAFGTMIYPILAPLAITIRRFDASETVASIEALADVLIDCVQGGASVSFMWPLPRANALTFWRGVAGDVARKERVLLIAEDAGGTIVGTAQLITAMPENQPHRAEVAKMLVHRNARRQGVAQRLLAAVDDAARAEGKTVLVLDTATGSNAERLYQHTGWHRVGVVPDYALMPDGAMCGTTFFHKRL